MALSATFTANFSSFFDAVDKAEIKLKDFGGGADKAGARLDRMAQSFSGQKIIQEASLMAKAIGDVENYAKLTDKELARVGATASEAVEKLKKLGQEVPQNIQKMADATKNANKTTIDWKDSLVKIAGAMGIAFSIDAVAGFIGSVFDAAGAIQDLSDTWGVSTDAVQAWSAAAKASGVEAETVGKSVQFLTEQLAEGSDAYKALLANVGLSYDKLRKMPLEDAYKEVIHAIAGIKDETLALDVAEGLLGASSKKMMGVIKEGSLEATDAVVGMSKETIKRLDEAGDAWARLKNRVVIYTGEIISQFIKDSENLKNHWARVTKWVGDLWENGFTEDGIVRPIQAGAAALNAFGGGAADAVPKVGAVSAATEEYGGQVKKTAAVLANTKADEEALQKAQAARAKALEDAKRIEAEYGQAVRDHGAAVDALAQSFAGGDVIGKAKDYLEALERSVPIEQMTAEKKADINKVMSAAIDAYEALGSLAPSVMYDIWLATAKADEALVALGKNVQVVDDTFQQATKVPIDLSQFGTRITLGAAPSKFAGLGRDLAGVMSESVLKAIQGGGNMFEAAGSAVGNFLLDPKQSAVGKTIQTAASKLPGLMGGAISAAIPAVGAFIGPAISWLSEKISGWFGKKEYEKLRDGFVQSAGGMAELTKAAQAAGISLDNLMRARKTEQVQAAIKTIQDALESDKLRQAFVTASGGFDALQRAAETAGVTVDDLFAAKSTDEVTKSIKTIEDALKFQADAYDLAIQTAQKYGFTLEELGPAMQRQELDKQAQQLYKDWEVLNAAGIDTIAITHRMAESVNQYVQDAMKMGTEIPSAMRPMLETMAKSGELLDENGNAITDLDEAGLSFAMTMSDGFKALIDQVSKLTDAISRSLGLAIKNVPDLVVKGRVVYEESEVPAPKSREPLESYQSGTDGFRNFGTGTPVMLHGWEAVVPRDESSGAFATVAAAAPLTSSAAASTSIVINAQGAFFDTPGDLQRLADRVNDALTAKFGLRNAMRAG